ncbi:hypothetical protein CPB84DRAFT_1846287 [Gymnopilus junonius]|uniref:Uncharacterized protein n=1 Tax=Gymnopilus junonius TaxID=109634 RepID=A0A9P5NSH0_GYMJU|nr:hypothetical protein CPB84DRAFT_1846287 [Gymnopilus junonius]
MSSTYNPAQIACILEQYTSEADINEFKDYIGLERDLRAHKHYRTENRSEWVVLEHFYKFLCDRRNDRFHVPDTRHLRQGEQGADREVYEALVREAEQDIRPVHVVTPEEENNLREIITEDVDDNNSAHEFDRLVHEAEQQGSATGASADDNAEDNSSTAGDVGSGDDNDDSDDDDDGSCYYYGRYVPGVCYCEGRFGYDSDGEIRHLDYNCSEFY